MSFARLNLPSLAVALVLASSGATHAATLLTEGFDDASTLAAKGWVTTNNSSPAGSTTWFQPATVNDFFPAFSGASTSYLAANYDSGVAGGTIDNWLITPTFSTASAGTVSVWLRGIAEAGYTDTVKFGFSNSGSSSTSSFVTGSLVTATGAWTQYSLNYAAGAAGSVGRFAVEYTGSGDSLDFIGVDSLSVTSAVSAVPEPASWAMLALGLAGIAAIRRRSSR